MHSCSACPSDTKASPVVPVIESGEYYFGAAGPDHRKPLVGGVRAEKDNLAGRDTARLMAGHGLVTVINCKMTLTFTPAAGTTTQPRTCSFLTCSV